jgi:tetratricopeptide (TPR) repeat protein
MANMANKELAQLGTETYYSCCGKSICGGCIHSFNTSGNNGKCPFCNERTSGKTDEEAVQEMMRRVEANDAGAIFNLGTCYILGKLGLLQDREKVMELWKHSAELGHSDAHFNLGNEYRQGGDLKKAKFHYEAAAMVGHELARSNLGTLEYNSGNRDRAIKHWTIAASTGSHLAILSLQKLFEFGLVSRDQIDSTLRDYNKSCAEMRSEARDASIRMKLVTT